MICQSLPRFLSDDGRPLSSWPSNEKTVQHQEAGRDGTHGEVNHVERSHFGSIIYFPAGTGGTCGCPPAATQAS